MGQLARPAAALRENRRPLDCRGDLCRPELRRGGRPAGPAETVPGSGGRAGIGVHGSASAGGGGGTAAPGLPHGRDRRSVSEGDGGARPAGPATGGRGGGTELRSRPAWI